MRLKIAPRCSGCNVETRCCMSSKNPALMSEGVGRPFGMIGSRSHHLQETKVIFDTGGHSEPSCGSAPNDSDLSHQLPLALGFHELPYDDELSGGVLDVRFVFVRW